jgi:hypothetical protein
MGSLLCSINGAYSKRNGLVKKKLSDSSSRSQFFYALYLINIKLGRRKRIIAFERGLT